MRYGTPVALREVMHTVSRCFTVRPTAAIREGYSVVVIDRSVHEAEAMCALLREDGHVADALTYVEALRIIGERRPQAIVIRMRLGKAGRETRDLVKRAFPHIHVLTFNAATMNDVREKLPARWTDLYDVSAPPPPRLIGQPRALREALEALL